MAKKKRTSLDAIFPTAEAKPERATAKPKAAKEKAAAKPAKPATEQPTKSRKQLAVYLEQPIYQQLRTLAFEEETKMHPLLMEGLDRVFSDRGLPAIAELMKSEE